MKTFIKWAGGKEKELPIIMNNLPEHYDRYVEPFVGGGAVFLNINCKKNIVNDNESFIKYETAVEKLKLLFFELDNLLTEQDKKKIKLITGYDNFSCLCAKKI